MTNALTDQERRAVELRGVKRCPTCGHAEAEMTLGEVAAEMEIGIPRVRQLLQAAELKMLKAMREEEKR